MTVAARFKYENEYAHFEQLRCSSAMGFSGVLERVGRPGGGPAYVPNARGDGALVESGCQVCLELASRGVGIRGEFSIPH